MRSNRNIRIGLGLLAGAVVLLLLFLIISNRRNNVQPSVADNPPPNGVKQVSVSSRRIAYALEDIPPQSILVPGMFQMEDLPEGVAPERDYITNVDEASGYITRVPIRKNTRLRKSYLVGHISEVGISAALREGMRAVTVAIPNKPTFHDVVRIGDTIDILSSFDGQESRTIVEGVRVLAVDVFVRDYPTPTSAALRGDYKAPGKKGVASPAAPGAPAPPPAPAPDQPTPAPNGDPQAPPPAAQPTPTPTPPPARPAPAIIVEVTPEQANRLNLAQNSGGVLDFAIVPNRPNQPVLVPGGVEARLVSVTKPQIAPYAERVKKGGAKPAGNSGSRGGRGGSGPGVGPDFPSPAPAPETNIIKPADVMYPPQSSTYDIPVYVDGKQVRIDTVRKP